MKNRTKADKNKIGDVRDKDLLAIINEAFENNKTKPLVSILIFVLYVWSLFSVTNFIEALISIVIAAAFLFTFFLNGKTGKIVNRAIGVLIIINAICALFWGPYLGYFSSDSIEKRNEAKFMDVMATSLYDFSIREYALAIQHMDQVEGKVPEEYLYEYYLWKMEAATYGKMYDVAEDITERMEDSSHQFTQEERDAVFSLIPLGKLVDLFNSGEYEELEKVAKTYNYGEQYCYAFELAAICLQGDSDERISEIDDLIEKYYHAKDSYQHFSEQKLMMLMMTSYILSQKHPCEAGAVISQIFYENRSVYFDEFLGRYPEENYMNVRWFSMGKLRQQKEVLERCRQQMKSNCLLYELYAERIENLGQLLGLSDCLWSEGDRLLYAGKDIPEEWGIYNAVTFDRVHGFVIVLEPAMDIDELSGELVKTYHYCTYKRERGVVNIIPIVSGSEPLEDIGGMEKLLMAERIEESNRVLIERIEGSGEYLHLRVVDCATCEVYELQHTPVLYHSSNFNFDGKNEYSVNFEIENCNEANNTTKVGGTYRCSGFLNTDGKNYHAENQYYDPALKFYAENRGRSLINPIINRDVLNGRTINDADLLDLLRKGVNPDYEYTPIQESYKCFLNVAGCRLSGLIVDYKQDEQNKKRYFYFVKRTDDQIELKNIYRIGDKLEKIY